MLSYLTNLQMPVLSRHDYLVRERIRLLDMDESLSRNVESLREMRHTLYESYQETKGWKFPWTRYNLMKGLITSVLEAYEQIREAHLKDLRNETLARHGLGDKASITEDSICDTGKSSGIGEAMTNKELEAEIEHLRIATTKLQEEFRQESNIFETLEREFRSLQKYALVQKYIIVKLLIKIAGKSDL